MFTTIMKFYFPTFLSVVSFFILSCDIDEDLIGISNIGGEKSELLIPEIIEMEGNEDAIELVMQAGQTEFFEGTFSDTFGYNGHF